MTVTRFRRVLIIDSGAGGLSVTQNILQLNPNVQVYYIADTEFFPYGALNETALIQRVEYLIRQTQQVFVPDVIVIACNTASTIVLNHLRERFSTPLVGVVPAIKPAAAICATRHFAVLATLGTIQRRYTHDLIHQFARGCRVDLIACPALVELAEKKLRGQLGTEDNMGQLIRTAVDMRDIPDTVVLACTHFPLLKEELTKAYPAVTHWIDSGNAIARRVQFLLKDVRPTTVNETAINTLWSTKTPAGDYRYEIVKEFLNHFETQGHL